MSPSAGVDRPTVPDRIAAIQARVEALREQTAALGERVDDAGRRVQRTREAPRATCTHGRQLAAMRRTLDEVERELQGLRIAMETRGVIEQAKGMLMFQRHCSADEAFQVLVKLSQTSHRKLLEVATTLVTTWTASDDRARA